MGYHALTISADLVWTIVYLYDKAINAGHKNGSTGEWFSTTIGAKQGCRLSPTLTSSSKGLPNALEAHNSKVDITRLGFADDIDTTTV